MQRGREGESRGRRWDCRARSAARRRPGRSGAEQDQPGLVDLRRAREDLRGTAHAGEAAPLGAARGRRPRRPPSAAAPRRGRRRPDRPPGGLRDPRPLQRRLRRRARRLGRGAARMEVAPAGRVEGAGRLALQPHMAPRPVRAPPPAGPWCRDGRVPADLLGRGRTSTMRPRYITAMRSATTRAAARSWVTNSTAMPELSAELADQVEDGGGQRHVERAGRLVAEQDVGRHHRGPGQRDPLALTPGELSGLESATSAGRPTSVEACVDPLAPVAPAVDRLGAQALADQLADRHPGGEGGAGVLEDHLGPRAAPELDAALVDRLEPGDGAQQGRLAAAALTDQSDRLALGDLEVTPRRALRRLAVERRPDGEALRRPRWISTAGGGPPVTPSSDRAPWLRLDAFGRGVRHVAPADTGHATLRRSLARRPASSAGSSASQASAWKSQRGPKGQPGGCARGSGGSPRKRHDRAGCGRNRGSGGSAAAPRCTDGRVGRARRRRRRSRRTATRRARRCGRPPGPPPRGRGSRG